MTRGCVNARLELVVSLRVIGPAGTDNVAAVVDTGFTAFLTLPPATVSALGLVYKSRGTAVVADGSKATFDVFQAEIEWDGSRRGVLVYAVGNHALIGMSLLSRCELRAEIEPGGVVEIRPPS